ncbi:MAG TPA: response regulator [Pseudomonadales bacterium]|nr:response regulator [Pseudomonadales bacterium]
MKRDHLKLLVVDDMTDQILILKTILMDEGFRRIADANDGKKALALIRKTSFDLIICDWNMPGMTGLQLLQEVRKHPSTSSIPFLMVTGESDMDKVQAAIKCGVSEYIVKPFTHEVLVKKALKLLSKNNDTSRSQAG